MNEYAVKLNDPERAFNDLRGMLTEIILFQEIITDDLSQVKRTGELLDTARLKLVRNRNELIEQIAAQQSRTRGDTGDPALLYLKKELETCEGKLRILGKCEEAYRYILQDAGSIQKETEQLMENTRELNLRAGTALQALIKAK